MVGAMSSSRCAAATKLTRRLLLPTPESPMRRILKEHSYPALAPAGETGGTPIPARPVSGSTVDRFGEAEAARNGMGLGGRLVEGERAGRAE